jgi:hypothetical protein
MSAATTSFVVGHYQNELPVVDLLHGVRVERVTRAEELFARQSV